MKIDLFGASKQFFNGNLSDTAKSGIWAIINNAAYMEVTQVNQVAYMLATAYHESAGKMIGIDEYGHGRQHPYGAMDPESGKIYYGRGIVQLTWKKNYAEFGHILGVDLINSPELANTLAISVKIMVMGMKKGLFTGVGLDHFIVPGHADFVNSRKIINSLDCADKIAEYAVRFSHLLTI